MAHRPQSIDIVHDTAAPATAVIWRPEAEWRSDTGTGEVIRLLGVMQGEMKRSDIQTTLGLKQEDHFREDYLRPTLEARVITRRDKP